MKTYKSLNPYYSGIYSMSKITEFSKKIFKS